MDKALALKDDYKITAEDVRKYIAPNATEKEFGLLMGICRAHRLNPFIREVHFVKYGNNPASIITGYETYLKRAERTGLLDGWKCWIEKDDIGEKAIVEIKRKDQSIPFRWEAYRKEFDKGQSTWKTMPLFMLKKVAIAQGFRLCFSEDLGGLPYIPEEMPSDKGGGVSESLPTAPVIHEVHAIPESIAPTDPGELPDYDMPEEEDLGKQYISEAQRKRMFAIAKNGGWKDEEIKSYLLEKHRVSSSKDIRIGAYDEIIAHIESHGGYGPRGE